MLRARILPSRQRRGIILLVVVSLLTLFAVVGLSFVLYAEGQANSARIFREARIDPDDDLLVLRDDQINHIIGTVLYGVKDTDDAGVYSPQRVRTATYGHEIAGGIYGWDLGQPNGSNRNTLAYSGMGLYPVPSDPNFVRFAGNTKNRRPEYYDLNGDGVPETYIPKNADYTYPDQKDLYLAAVKADGTVLVPSYFRPWLLPNPNNWWNDIANKDYVLRPLNGDPLTTVPGPNGFPVPEASTGCDVKNLVNAPGGNDSIWIDIGAPTVKYHGRLYRPLVAPLIIDLDSRINVNVAGNYPAGTTTHTSNQGWGPWEINLAHVLNPRTTPMYNPALDPFVSGVVRYTAANPPTQPNAYGHASISRFGAGLPLKIYETKIPTPTAEIPGGTASPPWANCDLDGWRFSDQNSATPPYNAPPYDSNFALLPGVMGPTDLFRTVPFFPKRYSPNGSVLERTSHPLFFNPYFFQTGFIGAVGNRVYNNTDMAILNGKYNYDPKYGSSELAQVFNPLSQSTSARSRNLITTISNDLDRVGLTPWQTNLATYGYTTPYLANTPVNQPLGGPIPFPMTGVTPGPTNDFAPHPTLPQTIWQSLSGRYQIAPNIFGNIAPLDLNRQLADYRLDTTQAYEVNGNVDANSVFIAQQDRQQFARDIFDRLILATFGMRLTPVQIASYGANSGEYEALRWLAQLAVNIVDFIDADDYYTLFQWHPTDLNQYVYGTELPRLVFNELYTRWKNDPMDPFPDANMDGQNEASRPYRLQFFIEMMNPLTIPEPRNASTNNVYRDMGQKGSAILRNTDPNTGLPYDVYQLVITRGANTGIRDAANTKGDPDATFAMTPGDQITVGTAAPNAMVPRVMVEPFDSVATPSEMPGTGAARANGNNYVGFIAVGSEATLPQMPTPVSMTYQPVDAMGNPSMELTIPVANNTINQTPTILLRRLAKPHLPPDPNAVVMGVPNPNFNPYITVDYIVAVPGQIYDFRDRDMNGMNNAKQPLSSHHSMGRYQPYAGLTGPASQGKTYFLQTNVANPPVMPTDGLHHTFYRQNNLDKGPPMGVTDVGPFNWLAHMDRILLNPMELLQVSAFKPHELTQQFVTLDAMGNTVPFKHTATWFDSDPANLPAVQVTNTNSLRLFRALGLLSTRPRMAGIGNGGRVPGRVNINTIWDPEILLAIFDAQSTDGGLPGPNRFSSNDIFDPMTGNGLFRRLIQNRTLAPTGVPGPTDTPYVGIAAPIFSPAMDTTKYPTGTGVQQTLLSPNLQAQLPILPNAQHPYYQNEPLMKTFNHFTTRSNTFMMICTMGYFELDANGRVGAELGTDDGNRIRHRFMSIIDRTNLTLDPTDLNLRTQGPKPVFYPFAPISVIDPNSGNPVAANDPRIGQPLPNGIPVVTVTARIPAVGGLPAPGNRLFGHYDGVFWEMDSRTNFQIDTGDNAQILQVANVAYVASDGATTNQDAGGGTLTFQMTRPHAPGVMMLFPPKLNPLTPRTNPPILGNPGPQPLFDYKQDRYSHVVPLVTQLKD